MDTLTMAALLLITFLAYFVKGLAGFGPALLVVPFFTLLAGVELALPASAFFDVLAGSLLLFQIYRQIDWKFCLPLMLAMGSGSFLGAELVFYLPLEGIRFAMGIFIFLFALFLGLKKNPARNDSAMLPENRFSRRRLYGVGAGFLGGVFGGLIGMSGPPLIMYMKQAYPKDFFRTQLIVVFMVENLVRLAVYQRNRLFAVEDSAILLLCLLPLLIGLWLGARLHLRISETHFNRFIALVLIGVSIKILW